MFPDAGFDKRSSEGDTVPEVSNEDVDVNRGKEGGREAPVCSMSIWSVTKAFWKDGTGFSGSQGSEKSTAVAVNRRSDGELGWDELPEN